MKSNRLPNMACCFLLFLSTTILAEQGGTVIENFEGSLERWRIHPGSVAKFETETVREGQGALRFELEERGKSLLPLELNDWSAYEALAFWAYSPQPSTAVVGVGLDSENPESDGWVYFYAEIPLDWGGWKRFVLRKADFKTSRKPTWAQVKSIFLSTSDWPLSKLEPGQYMIIDDIKLLTSDEIDAIAD